MMIIAEGLEQTYTSLGQALKVLHGINLTVEPQGFVAIVGPSGSGKTTLLGLLAGLDRPTAGRVELDGLNLNTLTEDERARLRAEKIGFVFQNFQLIPTLTARARDLLGRVGLADRTHHYPAQLSAGEQQRVALARAFANEPSILFADEPTGNLDAETGLTVIDLLVQLNTEEQTTLVLVTHDDVLASRAHRVIRIAGGRIVAEERPSPR
jgi:putative ABC transport system ATP-binding protein